MSLVDADHLIICSSVEGLLTFEDGANRAVQVDEIDEHSQGCYPGKIIGGQRWYGHKA